jgi:hypothetical protein
MSDYTPILHQFVYWTNQFFLIKVSFSEPSFEPLHHENCKQSEEDFARMDRILASDPAALERLQLCINYEAHEEEIPENEISRMMVPPVHHTSRKGHVECLKFLSKKGANMNSLHNGMTPLSIHQLDDTLFVGEKYEVMDTLLEIGAKVSGKYGHHGFQVLLSALRDDSLGLVMNMIYYGSPVENLDPQTAEPINGESPLYDSLKPIVPHFYSEILLICGAKIAFPQNSETLHHNFLERIFFIIKLFARRHPGRTEAEKTFNEIKEEFLQKLKLCRAFSGKIFITRDDLLTVWTLVHSFFAEHANNVNEILETDLLGYKILMKMDSEVATMMREPPLSLQCLSRIAVRNAMGRDMLKNIKYLPIPEALKDFMRFKDVLKEIEIVDNEIDILNLVKTRV